MTTSTLDNPAIAKAAASPLLWTLGNLGARKHFHLKQDEFKLAQKIAINEHLEVVNKALDQVALNRMTNAVVRNETKYAFVHRKFVEGASAIELAQHYVKTREGADKGEQITRALIYQISSKFQEWAKLKFAGNIAKALREVESLAAR